MSRPIRSSGIWSAGTTLARADASTASPTTTSVGSTIRTPASAALREVAGDGVHLVLLQQALAHRVPLRGEEGEDHAATDHQHVGLAEQVVDDAELVRHLGPAEHHDVRAGRVVEEPSERLHLGLHQQPGRAGEPLRHVVDAGLLAVHDAEPVGDERVGEAGEPVGQGAPLGVVLAGLAGLEADVLEHADLARCEGLDGGAGAVADDVVGERHGRVQQLGQPVGRRCERVARVRRALGPAEVRGDHDLRAARRAARRRVGRLARIRPSSVIRPSPSPSLCSGTFRSLRTRTVRPDRSPRSSIVLIGCRRRRPGRRAGWSSPTRCRTSRRP